MVTVTLPDSSQRQFDQSVTVAELAASIGAGLANATLAGKVNGKLVDASYRIEKDAEVVIITDRDPEGLSVIRHSNAHLLAQAVKILFPKAQVTIGPVIENGFYYDFAFERPFTPEDLAAIEKKMEELAAQDLPVTRTTMVREKAVTFFRNMGEEYKAQIIEDIPANEVISLYQQGDFIDLCRGPHVPSTGKLRAFKLISLPAPIGGVIPATKCCNVYTGRPGPIKKISQAYLHRLEEAEKRDHRKIGKHLDLFHTQEEAPGMVFWHDNGWIVYQQVAAIYQGHGASKRLPGSQYPTGGRPLAVGKIGALGEIQRGYVHHPFGKP